MKQTNELELIKTKYIKIAEELKAPSEYVFFYQSPQDLGYSHVEYNNGVFYYVITERGMELERRSTSNPDELLYWLVYDLTFSMASDYELHHRNKSEDSRRVLFTEHLELIGKINGVWAEKTRVDYNKVLVDNPFNDNKQPRYL